MKKALAILLAAGSLLCFSVGCGDSSSDKDSRNDSSSQKVHNTYIVEKMVSSSDAASSSLVKAGSSSLLELETKDGEDIKGTYWLTGKNIGANGKTLSCGSEMRIKNLDRFSEYIKDYFCDIEKFVEAGIYCKDGVALGGYVKASNGYFGTYPGGLITAKNYDYDMTVEDCVKLVEERLKDLNLY